jgi:hypothetical protein
MVYSTYTVNYFTITSLPLIQASLAEQDKRYVPVGRTVHCTLTWNRTKCEVMQQTIDGDTYIHTYIHTNTHTHTKFISK